MVASTYTEARRNSGDRDDAAAGDSRRLDDTQNVYSNFDMDEAQFRLRSSNSERTKREAAILMAAFHCEEWRVNGRQIAGGLAVLAALIAAPMSRCADKHESGERERSSRR